MPQVQRPLVKPFDRNWKQHKAGSTLWKYARSFFLCAVDNFVVNIPLGAFYKERFVAGIFPLEREMVPIIPRHPPYLRCTRTKKQVRQ